MWQQKDAQEADKQMRVIFKKRQKKKSVERGSYRQGSSVAAGWAMAWALYGEKGLSGLTTWTIIQGRKNLFEIIEKQVSEVLPISNALSSKKERIII